MKAQFLDKKSDFTLNEKCGYLTITSVKPFRQKCVCGTETKWTRTALVVNGVRSCGCKMMVKTKSPKARFAPGRRVGIFELLEKLDIPKRRWLVRCTRCLNEREVTEAYLYYPPPRHCENCP